MLNIIKSEKDVSVPPPLSLIINTNASKSEEIGVSDEYYDASDEGHDDEKEFEELADESDVDDFSRRDLDIDMSDIDDEDMDGNAYDQ